jgi:hydroxypyruvate isomerase
MQRREFLTSLTAASIVASQQPAQAPVVKRKGRIKQAAMRVNFAPNMPFEDMCREAARLGCHGFDFIGTQDWPTLKKYGLIPTMYIGGGITFPDGLIHPENHDRIEKPLHEAIDMCATNGCPGILGVGGLKRDMSYEQGADNCVAFLNRMKAHAEDKGVTICLEIMNSKFADPGLGRAGQICDHVDWGVGVVKRVNSPRVKFLFDIYHVQIMDGNIVDNIRNNIQWIGHFHTAGVPGRHELDDTQEINYRFVAKTIADLGFTGYVAHEYRPSPGHDPIQSLAQSLEIMDA